MHQCGKSLSTICQCRAELLDEWINFYSPVFRGNFEQSISEDWGAIFTKFVEPIGLSSALPIFFRFQICCFILKPEHLKLDWRRNQRQIFAIFQAKCIESRFHAQPIEPYILSDNSFGAGLLRELGDSTYFPGPNFWGVSQRW